MSARRAIALVVAFTVVLLGLLWVVQRIHYLEHANKSVPPEVAASQAMQDLARSNGVKIVDTGEAIVFTKTYATRNGGDKVTFSVFYSEPNRNENKERELVRERGDDYVMIWRDAKGQITDLKVRDSRNGIYFTSGVAFDGAIDSQDARDAQNLWNTYYNDMQLDKLIPYYLEHKPAIPMLTSPF